MLGDPRFSVGLMYHTRSDYQTFLNPEVSAFLNNAQMQPYVPQDSPDVAYMDLRDLSSHDSRTPIMETVHR